MDLGDQAREVFLVVREGRLAEKSDEELHRMIVIVRQFQDTQLSPGSPRAIEAIENELLRRKIDRQTLAVQKLRRPHWSLTPTFWITLAILIVALLSWLFPRTH